MLLQSLVDTIEQLKARLEVHGAGLRANETRTRMALIDPMLAALGWDPADPSLVVPEFEIGGKLADYALLSPNRKPVAVLEAKRLGESLTTHRMQMVNYGNMAGIPYAGLTDGNHWELYSVFEQRPIEDRRILDISLDSTPVDKITLGMLVLWCPHMSSGEVQLVKDPILAESHSSFPAALTDAIDPQSAKIEGYRVDFEDLSGWKCIAELNKVSGSIPPAAIRMPDGSEFAIRRWKDILLQTITWLHGKGMIGQTNSRMQVTRKRYLVNDIAQHPLGNDFREARQVAGASLYVETHWSANDLVRYTKLLMQNFGQNPENVYLKSDSARRTDWQSTPS